MQKKHIALLVISILIVGGLVGGAVYHYTHRPKPPKTETTAQAIQGQKNAEEALAIQDAANATNTKYYQSVITTKSSQVTQLCSELTVHKLPNTICQ